MTAARPTASCCGGKWETVLISPGKTQEHLCRLLKGFASKLIRRWLDEYLVTSSSEKGPLRIAFPHKVVDSYFPMLFTGKPATGELLGSAIILIVTIGW